MDKIYRRRPIGQKEVLDIGAGDLVDSRATHAIDLHPDFWNKGNKVAVDYYPKPIDIEKDKLPYESEKFTSVISYGALGWNFGNSFSYKEVYRVLKPGGEIEIGTTPENFNEAKNELTKQGFENITPYLEKYDGPISERTTIIANKEHTCESALISLLNKVKDIEVYTENANDMLTMGVLEDILSVENEGILAKCKGRLNLNMVTDAILNAIEALCGQVPMEIVDEGEISTELKRNIDNSFRT